MRYTVYIDGKPGAYGVAFPDCPGCVAMGDTIEEAIDNAGDALRDWVETRVAKGGEPPRPSSFDELLASPDAPSTGEVCVASVALVHFTGKPVRANMTLDQGVVQAIDEAAAKRQITRSAMVEVLAREHLPAMA